MKTQYAIVIGAILIGSIATVNWALVSDNGTTANTLKSSAGMMGHVTLTALNEDGQVIAYRQLDNVVINNADNCILNDVFNTSVGSCNSLTNPYTYVHIGTNNAAFSETSTDIVTYRAQTAGSTGSSTAASSNGGASTTITAAFLDVSASIAEAALKNDSLSASADVLALQNFTPISLGPTDDLTIQWTVTIDGN